MHKIQLPDFENTQLAFANKSNFVLMRDYSIFKMMNYPLLVQTGTQVASRLVEWNFKTPLVLGMKPTVYSIFCGGETLEKSVPKIDNLANYGLETVLDYGVEGKETEADFEKTAKEIIRGIDFAAKHDSVKVVCSKFTGLIPHKVLEKLHANHELNSEEKEIYERCIKRIERICEKAYENQVALFVDAEESWIQNPLDELTLNLMKKFNRERPIIFNTVQLYLKSRLEFCTRMVKLAEKEGFIYAAKLVRGAYMEKETKRAIDLRYPNPIQDNKINTDKDYDEAVAFGLQNLNSAAICVATHNELSCIKTMKHMNRLGIPVNHSHVSFSQLLGMSDHISFNMSIHGYHVSKYMPYGPVRDVIPYLLRRAQENTSVAGQMGRELQLLTKELKRRKLPVW